MLIWAVAFGAFLAESPSPDEALDTAIAVIEAQDKALRTIRVSYDVDANIIAAGTGAITRQTGVIHERRKGKLCHVASARSQRDWPSAKQDLRAFNGRQFKTYAPDVKQGFILPEAGDGDSIQQYTYRSAKPLSEMLKTGKPAAKCVWREIDGAAMLECVLSEENATTRTLWLDPKRKWQPRRIVLEIKAPDGVYPDDRSADLETTDILSYAERDGLVIPDRVASEYSALFPDGSKKPQSVTKFHVKSLEVNVEIPDTDFDLEFPEGALVRDDIRGVKFVVGKPGSERPLTTAEMGGATSLGGGSAATGIPPGPWWADWRLWMAACAVSVLAISLVAWRQARA